MNGLDIVVLGLSITSSWGNGHATTYRALLRELSRRGHRITFLERDTPWYHSNRDLPRPSYCEVELYRSVEELTDRFERSVAEADAVIIGSYVPDGIEVANWVLDVSSSIVAFYDIDTPVTIGQLQRGECGYLSPQLIPRFDLYLSFSGGNALRVLESRFGAAAARALYCSVDPDQYYPEGTDILFDLGYMGTYSSDRQPPLERLMLEAARHWPEGRFVVAGPQYPPDVVWPSNVLHIHHLAPAEHRRFYNSQRFTLNVTREEMVRLGLSPSVRLFEAAACGVPIISDSWPGLETLFDVGTEILISRSAGETLRYLREIPEEERLTIARKARERILASHTSAHRAEELEGYLLSVMEKNVQLA